MLLHILLLVLLVTAQPAKFFISFTLIFIYLPNVYISVYNVSYAIHIHTHTHTLIIAL